MSLCSPPDSRVRLLRTQGMTEDVTLRARKTSGQMSWLKAALEHSSAAQREEREQSRETIDALRVRIRALEDIVRERDDALRSCELSKNELAERVKRLDIEAETRAVDLDMKDRHAYRLEDSIADLRTQVKTLERLREENATLRREIDERERDARELERQVDAYRATARAAENRQATAELAAAKSERLVNQPYREMKRVCPRCQNKGEKKGEKKGTHMWGALIMMHAQFGVQLADMCSAKVASKWFAGACGCWGQGFAQCVSVNLCCSSLNRAVCRPYDATCASPVGTWCAGGMVGTALCCS